MCEPLDYVRNYPSHKLMSQQHARNHLLNHLDNCEIFYPIASLPFLCLILIATLMISDQILL